MRGFLVAGVVSAALMAGAPAGAAIVHVNCSHANLQKKINHAASGSTLQITGTCVGGFLIQNKNLKLIGDPQATLDARGVDRTLTLSGAKVRLAHLVVTGGRLDSGLVATGVGSRRSAAISHSATSS